MEQQRKSKKEHHITFTVVCTGFLDCVRQFEIKKSSCLRNLWAVNLYGLEPGLGACMDDWINKLAQINCFYEIFEPMNSV